MAVSTGPTGDGSEETPQDAVAKFQQWLQEHNYEDAVEVCPYNGREGGYQGAVDACDVVQDYLGEQEPELSDEEHDAVMAYALDIGQFADPKIWARSDEEHADECDTMADAAEAEYVHNISKLMYEYGVWTWDDQTAHQLDHIPPHGCSFVEWLHAKKCTKDFGAPERCSWTRPTQRLLAEFLSLDSSKLHISATDAEQLTAWVAEKMAQRVCINMSPQEYTEMCRVAAEDMAKRCVAMCDGKTAKEWRELYFQVLGELQEMRRRGV